MRNLLFVFFGVFVALVTFEFVLAIFFPQPTMSELQAFSFTCFTPGTYRWIKLQSNKTCPLKSRSGAFPDTVVTTNSLGLRNPEVSFAKPAQVKRVLFIGDSMTMGWSVDEDQAYPRVTEAILRKNPSLGTIETINAGFAGAGPSGYYLYLKLFGMQLEPDVVVVGLYILNDITSRRDVEWVSVDADGLPTKLLSKSTEIDSTGQMIRRNTPLIYRIPYLRQSHLFVMLANTLLPGTSAQPKTYDPVMTPLLCLFKDGCHDMDHELAEVEELLSGMEKIVQGRGKKILFVFIPAEFQVYPDVAKDKYGLSVPLTQTERSTPNTKLLSYCLANSMHCLDLLPAFTSYDETYPWWQKDDHWNPYGHIVAARTVAAELEKMLAD